MFTILRYFFTTLGVLFFALICAGLFVWYADIWGIQTMAKFFIDKPATVQQIDSSSESGDMSDEQIDALEAAGINTEEEVLFSEEEIQCFESILGTERVQAIENGAMPTPMEIMRAGECLE